MENYYLIVPLFIVSVMIAGGIIWFISVLRNAWNAMAVPIKIKTSQIRRRIERIQFGLQYWRRETAHAFRNMFQ